MPSFINNEGIVTCVNLGWFEVEFVSKLKSTFPEFDIFVENDATVAALAESKFGSMNGKDISVLITLGTGLGGGIIINGCFETFCSATALIKHTQEILKEENESIIINMCKGNFNEIDAKMVFDAYRMEDNLAKEVVSRFKHYLSIGIAGIVNNFDWWRIIKIIRYYIRRIKRYG